MMTMVFRTYGGAAIAVYRGEREGAERARRTAELILAEANSTGFDGVLGARYYKQGKALHKKHGVGRVIIDGVHCKVDQFGRVDPIVLRGLTPLGIRL